MKDILSLHSRSFVPQRFNEGYLGLPFKEFYPSWIELILGNYAKI
jgi:hypothetical protein